MGGGKRLSSLTVSLYFLSFPREPSYAWEVSTAYKDSPWGGSAPGFVSP